MGKLDKIRSLDDLYESLIGTYFLEETTIYRGQNNENWDIKPSLLRDSINEKHQIIETTLLYPISQNDKIPFFEGKDPVEYFTILQHYGIATRLLDFTKDPLIALFFACFDFENKNFNYDGVFIVTDKRNFNDFSEKKMDNCFFVKDYKEVLSEFNERRRISEIKYFEPVFMNPRSRCQHGCFLYYPFCPLAISDKNYVSLEDYIRLVNKHNIENNSENRVSISMKKVDKKYKKQILKELKLKHSISYESLMLPNLTSTLVEKKFQLLLDEIIAKYPFIEKIYYKNNKEK